MVPVRRCVGCRQSDSKDNLLRIVSSGGRAVSDESATMPGRGAYVHRNRDCLESSLRTKVWPRALREPGVDLGALTDLVTGEAKNPDEQAERQMDLS